jgi:hypothetical protein
VGTQHKLKGLKGQPTGPTPWPTSHTLSRFRPRLGVYIHMSVHKSIPSLRVAGKWEVWPAGHVDGRLVIHHLQTNSIELVEAPLDLYTRNLMVELTHTTIFLKFSTCKGSGLVVEALAKPCEESRVELSLRLSFESSLRDRCALVSLPFFIDFEL